MLDDSPNSQGESATPGQPNLYLWREGEGMRFIATLAEGDGPDWSARAAGLSAAASPQGRYLAFMSERPLTGYDNRDAQRGEAAQEVFAYDAASDALACLSCEPSGARPLALRPVAKGEAVGAGEYGAGGRPPADLDRAGGRGAGARGDEAHERRLAVSHARGQRRGPRLLQRRRTAGRRGLKRRRGRLSVRAPRGRQLHGRGRRRGHRGHRGRLHLADLLGARRRHRGLPRRLESGDDVFFYTPAQLSVNDADRVTDIYDARVGGEPAVREAAAECQGEACQPPPAPPSYTTGATATHHGSGNVRQAGRGRCAAPARKARSLSRRAKKLRRAAQRTLRGGAGPGKAKRTSRRARRLAHAAKRTSRRARSCRRRAHRHGAAGGHPKPKRRNR